ncbi:phytanoyl-CoA dioxygenase family protein [Streptomyces sp. cg35]|uniref:phytanoyl-CoA dioxygenase family protein n=1 Tax=Streptomyces sp. cg35 TaxID=3421650 RepID=UPI003D17F965
MPTSTTTGSTAPHPPTRESFRTTGHHRWRGFCAPDRVAELRVAADTLLASDHAVHTPESVRVLQVFRHHPVFTELFTDPRLLDFVDGVLGPGALLSDISLNQVHRGGKQDRWHIDYPYNDMPETVRGGLLGLQMVLPLTPFDSRTGATEFLPGSNLRYRQPPAELDEPPAMFQADPGDLLVLPSAAWHRAGRNTTDTPRTAVLMAFTESWIRPMGDPPEPGHWSITHEARLRLGMERT